MAQTIGVDREVSVTSGNGGVYPRETESAYASTYSQLAQPLPQPQQRQYQYQPSPARTRPRAKSASNLLSRPSHDIRFHDDTLVDQQDPERRQDGLAELIDFLRNHSPPSGNFMSIPEGMDDDERGRWHRLRKLGKRSKSLSKFPPQTIRLPDTAVSGTTTGGHRHIAISIPLDASPFGRAPRSQYPVYQHRNAKPLTSQYAPTRAILNDKGIVTVLRTVTEDRETSSSTSPAGSQSPISIPPQGPQSTTAGRTYSPGAIDSSSFGKASEYFNVPAAPPRVPSPDQVRQSSDVTQDSHDHGQGTSRAVSPNAPGSRPSRNPSLTGGRFVHPGTSSIDAMMSQSNFTPDTQPAPVSFNRPVSNNESYQPSFSRNIMTTRENAPAVAKAQPVDAAPVAARESRRRSSDKRDEEYLVTVITKSPLAASREKFTSQTPMAEGLPAPSAKSMQSRRDKVRDKKRKDMEALRNVSLKRRTRMISATDLPQDYQEVLKESPEEDDEQPPPLPIKSPQRHSICPIMVVANVKPSPPPTSRIPEPSQGLPGVPTEKTTESVSEPTASAAPRDTSKSAPEESSNRPTSPSPDAYMNGSSNPTPPQSAEGSPAHKQTSYDRTSLSRRREWNAAREEERKVREASANIRPRSKAKKLALSKEEAEDINSPAMEKEIQRRYEAYREYRIREMERRVRRLERNGDVWLRALVPVLDNLNRTLANTHDDQPRRAQGWVSDEEDTNRRSPQRKPSRLDSPQTKPSRERSPEMRPSRQGSRGRMLARAGTSEREFLEQLVRTRKELEAGSVSDDMSGFETIEPLMRELAGQSRLSFEARSLGVGEDDGYLRGFSD
ncbi:hypothetical protein FZEAL_7318 [Fusarium zealandicum]|uniref:Uncharacterized protein n=1 Tax=Fusarium zealandicum TaxID=1053134 RepID=A0A8H4XHY3_9HYPO|nr:hypothetical protein FZEAL_7318 [Fusarium zealandicum]